MNMRAKAGPCEDLEEHLRKVAQLAKNLASALGFSASDCNLVYIAGLLHDLGKAMSLYYRKEIEPQTFPSHEIISAIAAHHLLKRWPQGPDERERGIINYIILTHHQAIDSVDERMKTLCNLGIELGNEHELHRILRIIARELSIPENVADLAYTETLNTLERVTAVPRGEHLKRLAKEMHPILLETNCALDTLAAHLRARKLCGILMISDVYIAMAHRQKCRPTTHPSTYRKAVSALVGNILQRITQS